MMGDVFLRSLGLALTTMYAANLVVALAVKAYQ